VDYPKPDQSVDVVLLTLHGRRLNVLLTRRAADSPAFPGALALPGGYIHVEEDDDLLATARRVLREKANLAARYYLEQLYSFGGKFRDPRGWSTSVSWLSVVPEAEMAAAMGGVAGGVLEPVDGMRALPFDHGEIVARAVARLRGKASYSTLPMFLLPETFTMSELHAVYEQVMGAALDKVTFRRRIEAQGVIEPVPGGMRHGSHRPAQLYRRSAETLQEFQQAL
jgi:8-oxo-dGTP diphosphatase